MNVTNLSKSLTAKLLTSTSTYEMMLLSKSIQELKLGNVSVVNSFTDIVPKTVFGRQSVFFDGSGDSISINGGGTNAALGNIFTIEMWVYPATGAVNYKNYYVGGTTTGPIIYYDNATFTVARQGENVLASPVNPTLNAWNHIAVVREGTGANQYKLYINGILRQTGTEATNFSAQPGATIGDLNAYISNFRIVNGTAVYTTNFTPPTEPLTPIANTTLLTCQGYPIDISPSKVALTVNGNTVASNLNPFDVLLPPPPGNLVYVEDERTIYYKNTINGTTNWESLFVPEREIYGWGNNSGGALGDGSTLNRSSPTLLLVAQNNWTYIGTNDASCFATDINGYAYAWGANAQGQLGNNSTVATTSPVSIVGLLNNWTKIVGGDARTFGLRSNGEVFGWGLNAGFRLGDATSINKSSPSKIFSDKSWTDIAAGHYHCLGIASTGELFAWGENGGGQLGDGFQTDRSVPVRVQGNISDWSKIAGTENSSAAIRSNGQMYTWGVNDSGVLGNNTIFSRSSPHSVPYFADWKLVAGGFGHILALRNEGTLWAWGRNIEGCLADGTTINRSSPVLVIGGKTNWVNIAGFNSSASSIAIDTTGDVWVWGAGLAGLGDGFAVRRSSPVSIKPPIVDHLYQNWIQIAISENRFFALKG